MTEVTADVKQVESALLEGIKANSRSATIAGILMIICGSLAIVAPFVAGLSVTIMVGSLLLIAGVSECFLAFQAGAFGRGLLIFLWGVFSLIAGGYLISQPLAGLAAITIFLAAYFIATGIFELVAAIQMRGAENWGWMLVNAIVTFILGVMIWQRIPESMGWAVGLLFGIKMMFGGWALFLLGRGVKAVAKEAAAA